MQSGDAVKVIIFGPRALTSMPTKEPGGNTPFGLPMPDLPWMEDLPQRISHEGFSQLLRHLPKLDALAAETKCVTIAEPI